MYPEVFASAEKARSIVRYYRGANGSENRSELNPEHYVPRFTAPKSDEKEIVKQNNG